MPDVKPLLRDTAREEYFYQLGRLEVAREARAGTLVKQLEVVVQHAKEQVVGN